MSKDTISIDYTSSGYFSVILSITSSMDTFISIITQAISKKFIPKAKGLILNPYSQVSPSYSIFFLILLNSSSKFWPTSYPLTANTTLDY